MKAYGTTESLSCMKSRATNTNSTAMEERYSCHFPGCRKGHVFSSVMIRSIGERSWAESEGKEGFKLQLYEFNMGNLQGFIRLNSELIKEFRSKIREDGLLWNSRCVLYGTGLFLIRRSGKHRGPLVSQTISSKVEDYSLLSYDAGVSNFKTCSTDSKAVKQKRSKEMGEALFDLEQLLKSQKEALTLEEANILQTCKFKAVRQFTAGVITGASVALEDIILTATWKLSRFAQANISGGNAIKALDDCLFVDIVGLHDHSFSLDTCVDHILATDGSRLQKELANM
uniref:Uncharacterized protein n=1 Tax=Salix viminalis TaxID=40686 RepID=A0A6N2NLC0_SALVM